MRLSGQIEGEKRSKTNIYLSSSDPHPLILYLTYILPFYLTFYLTYFLTFYLTYILTFYLAPIWHSIWHFIWHIFCHSIWHSIWHLSGIFSDILSGSLHQLHLELAIVSRPRRAPPEPARMLGSILAEGRGEEETRRRWGGEVRSCACSNLETFTWQVGN